MNDTLSQTIEIPTLVSEQAKMPGYSSKLASGADVRACLQEAIIIPSGEVKLIPTGLRFAIPEGYEIQVRPRSGLALKHGITVLNTPGTIDADYRGELMVILINHGKEAFVVEPDMRIAQLVVTPVIQACFVSCEALDTTERGVGGFGHTGVR